MKKIIVALLMLLPALDVFASNLNIKQTIGYLARHVYIGVNIGGGSTEWKYLKDVDDKTTPPSLPQSVSEGGPSWGAVLGYVVSKNFSMELQYMQFADAHIKLKFPIKEYNRLTNFVSSTDAYSISGKFSAQVAKTHLHGFAAVGAGLVERQDVLVGKKSCITPYMSAGLDYIPTVHWILESGFQYYTGFGASNLHPVKYFIPFAWDAYFRLAYQF